jgi:hypothetical protein
VERIKKEMKGRTSSLFVTEAAISVSIQNVSQRHLSPDIRMRLFVSRCCICCMIMNGLQILPANFLCIAMKCNSSILPKSAVLEHLPSFVPTASFIVLGQPTTAEEMTETGNTQTH